MDIEYGLCVNLKFRVDTPGALLPGNLLIIKGTAIESKMVIRIHQSEKVNHEGPLPVPVYLANFKTQIHPQNNSKIDYQ